MEATQLAAGGASADDEVNATQPPVDADTLESTQPADNGGKACARFVRVAGRVLDRCGDSLGVKTSLLRIFVYSLRF